jgi:hypothetical protein
MFQTLTGSLIIFVCMFAIFFAFALFVTALLRWIFLTDEEASEATVLREPSLTYPYRKAA